VNELTITHDYYDHEDADRDINVVFSIERLKELESEGVPSGRADWNILFIASDQPLADPLAALTVATLIAIKAFSPFREYFSFSWRFPPGFFLLGGEVSSQVSRPGFFAGGGGSRISRRRISK
jgi:hypothetical protein